MSSLLSHLTDRSSFDILAAWADEAMFQRGLAYHKTGRIDDIACASQGQLPAIVDGTGQYFSLLLREGGGESTFVCTCPDGFQCTAALQKPIPVH